jgi:hypothetical protein
MVTITRISLKYRQVMLRAICEALGIDLATLHAKMAVMSSGSAEDLLQQLSVKKGL